ncbi:MAG: class I SAM-dependent rRNA methyltransferase, partial [Luteolibacter sp.]
PVMRRLLEQAFSRRSELLADQNDAVRLLDGMGDGIPGLIVETYAGRFLVSTPDTTLAPVIRDALMVEGRSLYHKCLNRRQDGGPQHVGGPAIDAPFRIRENGIQFEISFQAGYSQGIFLDQRDNRAETRRLMRPGMRLLNTFAYTGGFSVAAACAGAESTTLDLSQPYLDWAKRNFAHNGIDPALHHFCKGDTFHWLRRFAKQGRQFDAVVLDPPTFSRDEKGRVFRVERDFGELANLAAQVLAPGGWMLCCTNFRGITSQEFERMVMAGLDRRIRPQHAAMPPDFTDAPYLKSLWLVSS